MWPATLSARTHPRSRRVQRHAGRRRGGAGGAAGEPRWGEAGRSGAMALTHATTVTALAMMYGAAFAAHSDQVAGRAAITGAKWSTIMRMVRRLPCLLPAAAIVAAICCAGVLGSAAGAALAQSGFSVTFHAGYNMIAVPAGTADLGAGALFHYRHDLGDYEQLTQQGAAAGAGYWAAFDQDVNVNLGDGSQQAVTISAAAGAWVMIGDPSGDHFARVSGADVVYTYDPQAGYVQAPSLQPGQGAWALVGASGRVSVVPVASNGNPAVSPTPAPGATTPPGAALAGLRLVSSPRGYQLQVPQDFTQKPTTLFDQEYISPQCCQFIFLFAVDRGAATDAAAACAARTRDLAQGLRNGKSTAPVPATVPNAESAATCTFDYLDPNGVPYHDAIATAIRGQTLYMLNLDFSADFVSKNPQLEGQILGSYALTAPAAGSGVATPPASGSGSPAPAGGLRSLSSPRGYRLGVPPDWQARQPATFDLSYASPDGQQTVSVLVRDRGQDADGSA